MNSDRDIKSKSNRSSTISCNEVQPDLLNHNIHSRPHSSGFKSFLNWFKKVEKLQQEQSQGLDEHADSSSEDSGSSTATAASFAFLDPLGYKPFGDASEPQKFISAGPYTDTYKNLIKDRERRRALDKDLTLRKKYNLHSSGLTLNGTLKPKNRPTSANTADLKVYDTFSLPPLNKITSDNCLEFPQNNHRRAASETKFERPRSFVYVKGKRKAPPPPVISETLVRRRSTKKRPAPLPPKQDVPSDKSRVDVSVNQLQRTQSSINNKTEEIKPLLLHSQSESSCNQSQDQGDLSPRPWYKRQLSDNKAKDKKKQPEESKSEFGFFRYSKIFDSKKLQIADNSHNSEKRSSHILPNISELDREASEILEMHRKHREENNNLASDSNKVSNTKSAREILSEYKEKQRDQLPKYSEYSDKHNYIRKPQNDKGKPRDHFKDSCLAENIKPKEWACFQCRKRNDAYRIICFHCYSRKPKENCEKPVIDKQEEGNSFETEVMNALFQIDKISLDHENTQNNQGNTKQSACHGSGLQNPNTSNASKEEEKQKLRELLKEMKNSLPKRQKSNENINIPTQKQNESIQKSENVQSYVAVVNVSNKEFTDIERKLERLSSPLLNRKIVPKTCSSAQTENKRVIKSEIYENVEKSQSVAGNVDRIIKVNESSPNILLKELENAISNGDDEAAAEIAKKLAHLKVNCTVITSANIAGSSNESVTVDVFIEDQESHHGPIPLRISKYMTIAELKNNVEKEMNIPTGVQRWIIGKQLAVDDNASINFYNNGDFKQPLFLYIASNTVKPEKSKAPSAPPLTPNSSIKTKDLTLSFLKSAPFAKPENFSVTLNSPASPQPSSSKPLAHEVKADTYSSNHYLELVDLDNKELIENIERFDCPICMSECEPKSGVILRECLHSFCKECISNTIKYSEDVEIRCPFRDNKYSCESVLQEREIKALVPKEVFEQHLAKSIAVAESNMKEAFHCKTADCKGWCVYENTVNHFRCPICKRTNCLTCQAIHEGENCKQYQDRLKHVDDPQSIEGQRTRAMLEEMCLNGDAMFCPSCQVVLMKKWGCDWLKCSMCRTEICWVTRGPRWGPAGKGDITGGCQCGVNGVRCHPKCNYCH